MKVKAGDTDALKSLVILAWLWPLIAGCALVGYGLLRVDDDLHQLKLLMITCGAALIVATAPLLIWADYKGYLPRARLARPLPHRPIPADEF